MCTHGFHGLVLKAGQHQPPIMAAVREGPIPSVNGARPCCGIAAAPDARSIKTCPSVSHSYQGGLSAASAACINTAATIAVSRRACADSFDLNSLIAIFCELGGCGSEEDRIPLCLDVSEYF